MSICMLNVLQGDGTSMSAKSAAKVAAARRSSMRLLESESVEEEFKNTGKLTPH